jgi:hypothetical protein
MIKTLPIWLLVAQCIFTTEKEAIEKQAKEVLNEALNHAGFALLDFAISGFKASHGDAIGASLCAGHGIMNVDKAYHEFIEAKELFEQSREYEYNYDK